MDALPCFKPEWNRLLRESSRTRLSVITWEGVQADNFTGRENGEKDKEQAISFFCSPMNRGPSGVSGAPARPALTRVGAGQVVARVQLFDDVLVDLVPLTLRVTPGETQTLLSAGSTGSSHDPDSVPALYSVLSTVHVLKSPWSSPHPPT